MYSLNGTPGRTARINDEEWLFFSGYAYLGIHHLPEMQAAFIEASRQYGWLFPSARISNTQLQIFSKAENALSHLTQTAETVLFGSGYMAGRAAVETIPAGSVVLPAPGCHPAISYGPCYAGSFDEWAENVVKTTNSSNSKIWMLSDAVNPLTVSLHDFSFLSQLQRPAVCIIDDSHGIGLLGPHGEGISSMLPRLPNVEYIITYSLSKAMNMPGGAVSCSDATRAEALRNSHWYATTTPPPPAPLQCWLQNGDLYYQQLEQLRSNIHYLQRQLLPIAGVMHHPQLPVFRLPANLHEQYFATKNIIISSFAYPDHNGPVINRAVVSALHNQSDLDKLANAIVTAIK